MAAYLKAWGLVSAHGAGATQLARGLHAGISSPTDPGTHGWPVPPLAPARAFYSGMRKETVRETLAARLESAWNEASSALAPAEIAEIAGDCALIFASTKGCVEDYIWRSGEGDPYGPVVEEFLRVARLKPRRYLTVSNACASSHAAAHLAREWIERGSERNVIVLAADAVGPFVLQGFQSLRLLSGAAVRPFDRDRDGLLLGEAAGVAIFTSSEAELRLAGSHVDCEGHAVTRPEGSSASLQRAIQNTCGVETPDAVIAHGTATPANDRAEDLAFAAALPERPWVTGTKWSVGHTLGASGLVDLVAAAEWLTRQEPFALHGCLNPDPAFSSRVLTASALADLPPREWKRLLVTALGFGGVHAAFRLERS